MNDPTIIIGANGQLGHALRHRLPEAVTTDIGDGDIATPGIVDELFEVHRPAVVFNAAAYTDVNGAEHESGRALLTNAYAVWNLASRCRERRATLVHVSTDYVFDGRLDRPYSEDDPPDPLNSYGFSKWMGEHAARLAPSHYIVRTAWLFGEGWNFVRAILRRAEEQRSIAVVADQIGCPTFAEDLADALIALVKLRPAAGIYHVVNDGVASWADLAEAVLEEIGSDTKVQRITTPSDSTAATRPSRVILSTAKATSIGIRLPGWRDALSRYLASSGMKSV